MFDILKRRKPNVQFIVHGNNSIRFKQAKLTSVIFDIHGNDCVIEIGEGSILNNVYFYLRGDNHRILIGKECKFNRSGNIWIEDNNCSLLIDEKSTFEDVHFALTEPGSQIKIGRDCMFAYDIDIRTGDSHSLIAQDGNQRINYAKDIRIDDHVWVAAHVIILKGVCIPENSVVATGAVVTRPFETKGIVIGGNPARKVKSEITWSRERIYQK